MLWIETIWPHCELGRKFTSQMASYVLAKIIHMSFSMYIHTKMSRAYPYERIFRQNTYVNALAWTCLKLYIQSTSSTVYTLCICTAFSLALNIFYSKFKTFLDVTILWGAGVGLFSQKKKSNFSNLLKVHIFWEGHQIFQNLHLTFDEHYIGQK